MDVTCVNANIVSKLRDSKGMDFLDFKQVIAKGLIGMYHSRSRNPETIKHSKRSFVPTSAAIHLPEITDVRGKCEYCKNEGKESKTFIKCSNWSPIKKLLC